MYNHQKIEKKWQTRWRDTDLYKTKENSSKPKYYILDMFPYPSGLGLHVGHPKGYIATDIFARLRMMQGYNVLHPMGWDAFGLPAENYAIKNKLHPRLATEKNIANYKRQLGLLGLSYDWNREINTTDPDYYKWTQWVFLQMWKKGLAYESFEPINWCPSCQTGLANEDVEGGRCERCGTLVEQKPMRQWVLKITDYADRLLDDLDKLPQWEEPIKEMQRNWIGRSYGAEIEFKIMAKNKTVATVRVFTTRLDTIFGCSYIALAPENQILMDLKNKINNWTEVEAYVNQAGQKTDLQRTDLNKEKSGVVLQGIKAVNPFNNQAVPIFVADYVLNNYGTGAVMAVPAHDQRDLEFATKYDLPVKPVIISEEIKTTVNDKTEAETIYIGEGKLIDSGEFSGLTSVVARDRMSDWLKSHQLGARRTNYKIKDWVYSRQRYWGEPIPLVHCAKCGVVPVAEKDLPVRLPEVDSYEPTGNGQSPLAAITDWVETTCPSCGGPARRETNTMPQWGGSCWYYLRFIDPHNDQALVDKTKEKHWSPVDFYVGGAEHATRHLIYARFWHKFLFDIGVVNYEEPFTRLQHVGLIMGEDGRKMSKRWENVINPDDVVSKFGADSLRLYEMFMGPFEQAVAWNTRGLIGVRKFLDKLDGLFNSVKLFLPDKKLTSLLHKTIKKVGDDIESFNLNTAVSALMILTNGLSDYQRAHQAWGLSKEDLHKLVQILAPFAPHLAEEFWEKLGHSESVFTSAWPQYDPELIKDEIVNLAVQVNGKLRTTLEVARDISEAEVLKLAQKESPVKAQLRGRNIVRTIFVPGRLLNIVVAA